MEIEILSLCDYVVDILGKSQKKNAAMLDSDDTDSVSSSSTVLTDNMLISGVEDVQVDTEALLDQCLDALYEKRGSTREKALASIIEAFTNSLEHEFVEKKFATLLHQCLNSIKKGSAKEIALASHMIGLLALTAGPGGKAQEILEESVSPILEALKTQPEISKISSLNFLKHFLGGGFVKHMQENQFLQDALGFTPKKKLLSGVENRMSNGEKRMYKSPNSALNKARTQLLNRQRMLSQVLHFLQVTFRACPFFTYICVHSPGNQLERNWQRP
ncbi:interferon-related developmental regulator 1-like [Dorcoceras hygrometricum]|uniref:Interferon-related developmental regulator 1-like n=1 Tax=Dorcoceras hygrometricum TaxID=472368 RepID=A0A2Z7DAY0_9LAMI|nr:interferon-related developmental regulator 1-like [Dorcoceras hygrometricum]